MDLAGTRAKRTADLIQKEFQGVRASFARKIEVAETQVARWFMAKDNKHRRNIGEKMARHIEDRCGLAPYWLDSETGDIVAAPRLHAYKFDDRTRDKLLLAFNGLTPPQRKRFLDEIQELAEQNLETARYVMDTKQEGKKHARARVKAAA